MCHSRSCGFLGLLADHGVLHDGVAEVIHYRRDGEDAAQPLIQTFLRHGLLGVRVRVIRGRQSHWGAVSASPATTLRLVIEVERACTIGYLLGDGFEGITVPSRARSTNRHRPVPTGSSACSLPCTCLIGALLAAHLDGFEGKRFPSKLNWTSGFTPAQRARGREMADDDSARRKSRNAQSWKKVGRTAESTWCIF
jgi:hypothetical protein